MPETEQNLTSNPSEDQASIIPGPQQMQSANQLIQLSDQQLVKLQSELDVVQGNMRVLSEMLAYLTSPEQASNQQPDAADIELLTVSHFKIDLGTILCQTKRSTLKIWRKIFQN